MAKPLAKYVGGKRKLAAKIIQLMSPHSRYIEAFAGMMSVFLQKGKSKENVINDKNDSLVNLFTIARDRPDELINLIRLTPYASSQYNEYWNLYFNRREEFYKLDPIKRALIYYVLLEWAFNSHITENKEMKSISFSTSNHWASHGMITNIREWSSFCQGVVFLNWDYSAVLEKFCTKDSLVYLDPPYVVAENENYYEFNFNQQQHREMAELVRYYHEKTGANFIISYDSVPYLKELYPGGQFVFSTIKDVAYSLDTCQKGQPKDEYLITTYSLDKLGLFSEEE